MSITAIRLRALREKRHLSQQSVADYLGISRTSYNKYESGVIRPTRKLEQLAALFGVSVDYILGRSNELPDGLAADPYLREQWRKYLLLSDKGREMVDMMLNAVHEREHKSSFGHKEIEGPVFS